MKAGFGLPLSARSVLGLWSEGDAPRLRWHRPFGLIIHQADCLEKLSKLFGAILRGQGPSSHDGPGVSAWSSIEQTALNKRPNCSGCAGEARLPFRRVRTQVFGNGGLLTVFRPAEWRAIPDCVFNLKASAAFHE